MQVSARHITAMGKTGMDETGELGNVIAGTAVVLLCFVSGTTDVLSYLTLGHVFTSAMTGSMALFFIALVSQKFATATRAGLAITSYAIGGAAATSLRIGWARPPRPEGTAQAIRVVRLLIAEAVILALYCVMALRSPHLPAGTQRYVMIALSASAMGIQSVIARTIHETGIMTVVLNVTLTDFVITATKRLHRDRIDKMPAHSKLQMIAVGGYAFGAAGSALGVTFHHVGICLLPLAAVLVTLALCRKRRIR